MLADTVEKGFQALGHCSEEFSGGCEVLIFEAGAQFFSVPIRDLFEVICPTPLIPVPHTEGFCLGLGTVRDLVFPVVDFAQYLSRETIKRPENVILLVETQSGHIGLHVDRALAIKGGVVMSESRIQAAALDPSFVQGFHDHNGRACPCLDLKKLLGNIKIIKITSVA